MRTSFMRFLKRESVDLCLQRPGKMTLQNFNLWIVPIVSLFHSASKRSTISAATTGKITSKQPNVSKEERKIKDEKKQKMLRKKEKGMRSEISTKISSENQKIEVSFSLMSVGQPKCGQGPHLDKIESLLTDNLRINSMILLIRGSRRPASWSTLGLIFIEFYVWMMILGWFLHFTWFLKILSFHRIFLKFANTFDLFASEYFGESIIEIFGFVSSIGKFSVLLLIIS